MGCGPSHNDEASLNSRRLDAQINKDARVMLNDTKMLLLGPGESGKSTLFKQMKILAREGGYSESELTKYKANIYCNCISQMQLLCELMNGRGVELPSELLQAAQHVLSVPSSGDNWTIALCDAIMALWASPKVQEVYNLSRSELNESSSYFFDALERFRDPQGYTPTAQDVLRARVRSTGIEEAEFKFDDLKFRMFDVGGQRSERRKWIHCFAEDHELLTNQGFRGMAEVEAALRDPASRLLVAGYSPLQEALVFERPLSFVYNAAAAQEMIAVEAPEAGVSLLVTPGHDMYVAQRGAAPRKVQAGLLPSMGPVHMLTRARNGVARSSSSVSPPYAPLSEEESVFLRVLGAWIVAGSIEAGTVMFPRVAGTEPLRAEHGAVESDGRVTVHSAQWAAFFQRLPSGRVPQWAFECLSAHQLQWLLQGAQSASGAGEGLIVVESAVLRDELLHLCLLAGFSAQPEGSLCVSFSEDARLAEPAVAAEQSRAGYSGATWCVTMPSGFVVARRPQSRAVVVGNCFDSVTVVIFCASLSEYDQTLREDSSTNRMKESLMLFEEIVDSPWFRKTPVVLFLNKIDLFREKITRVPLRVCFGNYTGRDDPDEAKEFIRQRFLELPHDKGKSIYCHWTCAINTQNVEVVFRVVKETLLREVIQSIGP